MTAFSQHEMASGKARGVGSEKRENHSLATVSADLIRQSINYLVLTTEGSTLSHNIILSGQKLVHEIA